MSRNSHQLKRSSYHTAILVMQFVPPSAVANINRPDLAVPTPTKPRLSLRSRSDDNATREALSILSGLYTPSGPTLVAKEEEVVLHDEVDEVDGERIKVVPSFLRGALAGDPVIKVRKHLRRDIENKLEEGRLKFLAAFGAVDQVRIAASKLIYHSRSKRN